MKKGEQLSRSEWLASDNELFSLLMRKNGQLELYFCNSKRPLWVIDSADRLAMQSDGNLVLFDSSNNLVWESGTKKSKVDRLVLQNDGNLAILSATNQVVWSLNSSQCKNFSLLYYL